MREVTAVGPHVHEGRSYVTGEKMLMSDVDADWYAQAIVEGRSRVADNPMIAAVATPPAPADRTAHPDVETRINSDERSGDDVADELRNQVLMRNETAANAEDVSTNTTNQTLAGNRDTARADFRREESSTVET